MNVIRIRIKQRTLIYMGENLVKCVYDTPSDWAKETVDNAIKAGIVPDEIQSRYRKNITRENFCKLAYELPLVKTALENKPSELVSFTDTDNQKVIDLCSTGIIKGVGDGKFSPYTYITREEAAVILARIYALSNSVNTESSEMYRDNADISDWAKTAVYDMRETGIMNGVSKSEFSPKGNYTTEQAIATMLRMFNTL